VAFPPPPAPVAFPPPPATPAPPAEPVQLRRRIRAAADSDPAGARRDLADGGAVADELWRSWRAELEVLGADRAAVAAASSALARELWLWVMGERQWPEVAALVYGRVGRHLPAATSTSG
jgi:hypothetical protein